jgi:superfamily II DNA/RNA helicase
METTFESLSLEKEFLRTAWEKAGFQQLTAIQSRLIPFITQGKDIIAESPTGTGKTLAYLLPILEKMDPQQKSAQAIVIAPTRELVMQIYQQIQTFTKDSMLTGAAFIGGADIKRQLEKLKTHPQIIVGTPERVRELAQMKKLKMHEIKTIVVDEADQILKMNLLGVIEELVSMTQRDRQVIFVSATIPPKVEQTGKELMKTPEVVRVLRSELPGTAKVEHIYIVCERRDKWDLLRRIVKMDKLKALAFINDAKHFNDIAERLRYKQVELGILNGEMKKVEREAVMNHFRMGKFPLLLATDLAARGLDIEGITHVIHYDLPNDPEQYVHRSGRTGRMGAAGTVISLVTAGEVTQLRKMTNNLGIPISEKQLYAGQIEDVRPAGEIKQKPVTAGKRRPRS